MVEPERTDMTLTKRDLVIRISEETGLIQTQIFDVVQMILNHITESLAKGDKVELRNFGIPTPLSLNSSP